MELVGELLTLQTVVIPKLIVRPNSIRSGITKAMIILSLPEGASTMDAQLHSVTIDFNEP